MRVLEPHDEDGGFHFFVMEFVSGGDLHRAVVQKRIAADQVVPLLLRIGAALREAHAKGLVHRDVKPANILLGPSGEPRLTDFDLVAADDTTGGTRTGAALGTFLYSAPEAMAMDGATMPDARADVYGLGMTALFCLYGAQLPLDVVHDRQAFLRELPCDGAVKAVLEKAVAWKREKRFASVEDFCAALLRASLRRPAARSQRPAADAPVVPSAAPIPAAVAPEPAVDSVRAPVKPVVPGAIAQPAADLARGAQPPQGAVSLGQRFMAEPAVTAPGGSRRRLSIPDAPSAPALPGARPGLHELKFLQGIWQDPETGALACAREHRGELRMVIKGKMTQGELLDWRLDDQALPAVVVIGRFSRIVGSTSGYAYFRVESTKRLVGGWWSSHKVPAHLVSQLPNVKGMVPQTWVRQPSRHVFPEWAEDFFSKLAAGSSARR